MTHVVTKQEVVKMQNEAEAVMVDDSLLDYLMSIVSATRQHDRIRLGASTRSAQFFLRAARAHAYYERRNFIVPDDIKTLAPLILGHLLVLKTQNFIAHAEAIIHEILERIPVPI